MCEDPAVIWAAGAAAGSNGNLRSQHDQLHDLWQIRGQAVYEAHGDCIHAATISMIVYIMDQGLYIW